VTELSCGGEASVDRFFSLGESLRLRVGVDARAEWIAQTVRRADAGRAAAAGFPVISHFSGAAFGGGAHIALRVPIGDRVYVDLGGRALALSANTASGVDVRVLGGAFVASGLAL
jgi:hypothetical protein